MTIVNLPNGKFFLSVETRLKSCNDQILSLQKKIKTPYKGDLLELDRELEEFDNMMCVKQAEQEEQEETLKGLRSQEKELQKSFNTLDKRCFEMRQQVAQKETCANERACQIKTLCSALDKECPSTLVNEEDVLIALKELGDALKNKQECLKAQTATNDAEDQRRQLEIDDLRVELTKVEQHVSTLKKQEEDQKSEQSNVKRQMFYIEKSTERIKQLIEDIEYVGRSYEQVQIEFNKKDFQPTIEKCKERVSSLQQQFHKLDERHSYMSKISKQLVEISVKKQELEKRELEVRRLKSKHSEDLKKLLQQPVESNYRRSVQQINDKLQREIASITAKINKNKQQEQSLLIQRKRIVNTADLFLTIKV